MGITSKTRKMLWGKSGNRCAMPDCKKELVVNISEINNHSIIGEECHIIAQSPDGPRGNENFDINKIDDYDNLILMCGEHHTIIDDKSNLALFTVEKLQNMKKEHENWVFSKFTFEDRKKLDDDLQPLFLLGGFIIDEDDWKKVDKSIEDIKQKYEITDRFNEIIKPKDEITSPFIEQLTGITNEVVKEKHHFDYAGTAFQEWAAKIALRIFEDLDNGVFIDNEKNGKANHFKLAKMS